MKNNEVMVSVCMITYNHENFIHEAIEGVLMQKTNFSIELIIGEDCSTDNTRKIVLEYAEKYPDIIRPLLPDSNLGMIKKFFKSMEATKGKYIALCEGDDFWTDQYKLQKQVDFLEENESIVAVTTNATVCDNNGNTIQKEKIVVSPDNKDGAYNLHEFFRKGIQYPTLTVVFRNRDLDYITTNMHKMANPFLGNWTLWVLLHTLGDFYFINQVTASYRVNPNSVTHTVNAVKRWEADFMIRRKLVEIIPSEYHRYLKDDTYTYHMMGMAYRKQKKMLMFFYCQFIAFIKNPKMLINILYKKILKQNQNHKYRY